MSSEAYRAAMGYQFQGNGSGVSESSLKSVLLCLAWYADKDGREAFPGAAKISSHTCLSVRGVRRALKALESLGVIQRGQSLKVKDTAEKSAPTVYSINMSWGDGASPLEGSKGDGVSPLSDGKGDGVSPLEGVRGDGASPVRGDGVTPLDSVRGDGASPKQETTTTTTEDQVVLFKFEDSSEGLPEASRLWASINKKSGLISSPHEDITLMRFIQEFSKEEVLDAISSIGEDEHPRPKLFWIKDRITQRRKRDKKREERQKQQQRNRPGITIESDWGSRSSQKRESMRDRLKKKGNP